VTDKVSTCTFLHTRVNTFAPKLQAALGTLVSLVVLLVSNFMDKEDLPTWGGISGFN
jgi:hypothetical protein